MDGVRGETGHYQVKAVEPVVKGADVQAASLATGARFTIQPETQHLIANRAERDCRFLLVQGIGAYDWVKAPG